MNSFLLNILTLGGYRECVYCAMMIVAVTVSIFIFFRRKYSVCCCQQNGYLKFAFSPCMVLIYSLLIPIFEYTSFSNELFEMYKEVNMIYIWRYSYVPLFFAAVSFLLSFIYCRNLGVSTCIPINLLWKIYIGASILFFLLNPWTRETWKQFPISIALFVSFVCFSLVFLNRLSYILWLIMVIGGGIVYVSVSQSIELNSSVLMQAFGASWQDAKVFFTLENIFLFLLVVFFAIIVWKFICKSFQSVPKLSLWCCCCFHLFIALCVMFFTPKAVLGYSYAWPFGALYNLVYNSVSAKLIMSRCEKLNQSMPLHLPLDAKCFTIDSDTGVVCIVHIGESVRADHMTINGYNRCTTPWLASQKSLINFQTCISSAMYTDKAVLTMLTNGRRDFLSCNDLRYLPSSPPLLDFFHVSGFKCAAFWDECYLDNHIGSLFPQQIKFFSRSADRVYGYQGPHFHKQLDNIIEFSNMFQNENIFMLINNYGSHTPYTAYDYNDAPYPVDGSFLYSYKPAKGNLQECTNMINKYDNTIYYLDEFIKKIASHFKGKPIVYIYMSDHGEPLGENGYWTRSFSESRYHHQCSCKVPFFVWFSYEFEQAHPHFKQALAQLRYNQDCITAHEHLFHTVLGLMGIETMYYDSSLDLCTPFVTPYSGNHPF